MDLWRAVDILAGNRPSRYLFEREFAVAAFSGWLNSPSDPTASTSTVFVALCRAVKITREMKTKAPEEWVSEIFNAEEYVRLISANFALPIFWHLAEANGYNNCVYVADVVRFMLTYRPKHSDKRKKASLGKSFEFINKQGGFGKVKFGAGRSYWCGLSAHQTIWRLYKSSSVFQCVRFHNASLDWYIDPLQVDFLDKLTIYAMQGAEVAEYFAKALDLQNNLKLVIDARSMSHDEYFSFPLPIEPVPCRLPAMTATAYGKMAGYHRDSMLDKFGGA